MTARPSRTRTRRAWAIQASGRARCRSSCCSAITASTLGARVVGIHSGSQLDNYNQIATDTGAVRADGSPLVFTISSTGSDLDSAVVDAVAELVGGTPQDVNTRAENVPGNPDDFDATMFIKSITPVEDYRPDGTTGGYDSKDDTTFYGVIPGTQVEFEIDFWNDVRMPSDTAEIFEARIIVVGNGVTDLDERNVYIIAPPEGGTIPTVKTAAAPTPWKTIPTRRSFDGSANPDRRCAATAETTTATGSSIAPTSRAAACEATRRKAESSRASGPRASRAG